MFVLAAGKAEGGLISKGAAKEAAEEGMQLLRMATAILQVNVVFKANNPYVRSSKVSC